MLIILVVRAWITVDNALYLWNYFNPDEFEVYDALTEVIISSAVSVPKAGIFQDSVKYVLTLATPAEVFVMAICTYVTPNGGEGLKLVPTAYSMPTDNVTMLKIVGSLVGRIFMAGNDGNIYELDYCYAENPWASIVGGAPQHKCRKINHCAWQWKLVHILPPFLRSLTESEDLPVDIVMDNLRNVLYAITSNGTINAFYLGNDGSETHFFGKSFSVLEETRTFLSSGKGGSESAPKADSFKDLSSPGFQVVGIYPIPLTESKKVHAVVALSNGIRIYISLMSGYSQYCRIPTSTGEQGPTGMEIAHVRSPPSPTLIANCTQRGRSEDPNELESGMMPSFSSSQSLRASCAYYSHGLYFLGLVKPQQPDELVVMFEDLGVRANASGASPPTTIQPCLREGVTIGLDANVNTGKIYDIKDNCAAILNPTYCELKALSAHSLTPSNNSLVRETSLFAPSTLPSTRPSSDSGVGHVLSAFFDNEPPGIAKPCQHRPVTYAINMLSNSIAGYDAANLDKFIVDNDLYDQHLPATTCFTQRQVLVLTDRGIHVFRKLRPADIMQRFLAQQSQMNEEMINRCFAFYGLHQASVLCVGLACGTPRDAGEAPLIDNNAAKMQSTSPSDAVRAKAINTMRNRSTLPSYRVAAASTASTLHDSRLVMTGTTYDFIKSSAHDALFTFLSRILRPIWLRPVVGRNDLRIPSFWRSEVTDDIKRPLMALADMMDSYYTAAIRGSYNRASIDPATAFSSSRFTDHIAATAQQQQAQQQAPNDRTLNFYARNVEDASLQAFYLLVCRSAQALSLLDILQTLFARKSISISLADLSEMTFRSLVVLPKAQISVKKIIQEVIQVVASAGSEGKTEEVIGSLARDCYHFFSSGNQYAFEAFRIVDMLARRRNMGENTSNDHTSASKAVDFFLKAAASWNCVEDAIGDRSELQRACTAMLTLGSIGYAGVVDLTLKAAANFKQLARNVEQLPLPGNRRLNPVESVHEQPPAWDRNFFHGGSLLTPNDAKLCIEACYKCLVQQIIYVGANGDNAAMVTMVQRAVRTSDDINFHKILYIKLVDEKRDVLLSVESPYLTDFLREYCPVFLFTYYKTRREFRQAKDLMTAMATDENDVAIADRLTYFRNAWECARAAYELSDSSSSVPSAERILVQATVSELKDLQDIAEHQQIAFQKLSADLEAWKPQRDEERAEAETMRGHVNRLGFKLLDVNTLFRDICQRYKFWDICIMLIHLCGKGNQQDQQDQQLLCRFWRSFIYR